MAIENPIPSAPAKQLTTIQLHRKEYVSWMCMRNRCNNPKERMYYRYGGRGITICERWSRFLQFLADVGPAPTWAHTLDRIDPDGNYEPGNVRWATRKEQQHNTSANRRLTHDGATLCLAEWAAIKGLTDTIIRWRLNKGWSVHDAIETPRGIRGNRFCSVPTTKQYETSH